MSDPVTNSEVEDVLSSIRRLVSEGSGSKEPDAENPEFEFKSTARQEQADKLVLTQSLRVTESDDQPEQADGQSEDPETDAQIDAAHEDEADGAADVPMFQHTAPDTDATPKDVYVLGADPNEDKDWEFESARAAGSSDGEVNAAELEEFVAEVTAESDDHAEAEVSSDVEAHEAQPDFASPEAEPVEEDVIVSRTEDELEEPEQSIQAYEPEEGDALVDAQPVALSAKIAALEAVIGERKDQWEPDGLGADEYAGTQGNDMAWDETQEGSDPSQQSAEDAAPMAAAEDVQSDEDIEAPMHEDAEPEAADIVQPAPFLRKPAEDAPEASNASIVELDAEDVGETDEMSDDTSASRKSPEVQVFSADEDVLDEEALREMVADIVRQELQGTLGERITRNVRKLVRREIHRALASHNLD